MEQKSINGGSEGGCINECGPATGNKTCPANYFCQEVPCTLISGHPVFYCVSNGPGNQ